MPKARPRSGKVVNHETPSWTPLEDALRFRQLDRFMWMHELLLTDGTRVHSYKHCDTRNYLHLGEDGRAFHCTERGLYKESDLELDIWSVLPSRHQWLELGGYAEDLPFPDRSDAWGREDDNPNTRDIAV